MNDKLITRIAGSEGLTKIAQFAGRGLLKTKVYSPELALVGGLVAGAAAAVLFARAYKDQDDILGPIAEDLAEAKLYQEKLERKSNEQWLVDQIPTMQGRFVGEAVKLYGPPMALAATSVYLLVTSHGILRSRNSALAATVGVLQQSFAQYRQRVVADQGFEADQRYYYGAETSNKTLVSTVDGKKVKTKVEETTIPESISPMMYARMFDSNNPEHVPDRNMNFLKLRVKQSYWNDMLLIRGHVMLNEVYDSLRIPRTPEGSVVGWSLYSGGDNFIDFGLDEGVNQNQGDNRFLLNFNVNGTILDFIAL